MIMFFKSVNITVADVFTICMGLRKSLFREVLESESFLETVDIHTMIEAFETVHAVFDANLAGVLNSYTKTISEFNVELKKQIKENREKDKIMALQARQAAMGEIITMLAHQWRQPLASISMMINNILLDFELDSLDLDQVKNNLDSASRNIMLLSDTIDQFRKFFKTTSNNEPVAVSAVIDDLNHLIAQVLQTHKIGFNTTNLDDETILTNRQELVQVLLNIVNNAKEILLERKSSTPLITLETKAGDTGFRFIVCDNAGGIDEAVMPHIFEPYYSTKMEKNGTGLGLYIAQLIVSKHLKGTIRASNTESGACFIVELPRDGGE